MASDVFIKMRLIVVTALFFASLTNCQKGLYAPEEGVKILDLENFNSTVFGSQNTWMVEFYSSWCGHCIRFAPTWKQLARNVKAWRSVVTMGAVNCADEKNVPVCRHYEIEKYPTIKFFPAMALSTDKGEIYSGKKEREALKKFMVAQVEKQSASNRPPSWPKLHLMPSLEMIWHDIGPKVKKTVIFFETDSTDIGRELMLQLVQYHPALTIRRMKSEAVTAFAIKAFPSAYSIDQGGTFQLIASKTTLEGFVKALQGLIDKEGSDKEDGEVNIKQSDGGEDDMAISKSVGLHIEDLESALHYSLRQEIATCKTIEKEKLKALRDYVAVLAKYYPGRESTNVYLETIEEWLTNEVDTGITGEKWLSGINELQSEDIFLPASIKWVRCAGSSPKFRGYPCSLWSLFHTLTVTAAIRQKQEPIDDFNSQEVLLAMRGYIKYFFGCHECSENFQKMAKTLEEEVSTADGAVLWLWNAHNRANKRLHGDASEDPHHPKIQYPSEEVCDRCWKKGDNGSKVYNEPAVLKFLKKVYSNIIGKDDYYSAPPSVPVENDLEVPAKVVNRNKKYRENVAYFDPTGPIKVDLDKIQKWRDTEKLSRLRIRSATSWGFTSLDMSLCVLFYIICTMIVCLLYLHLSVHKKKSIFALCRRGSNKLYV